MPDPIEGLADVHEDCRAKLLFFESFVDSGCYPMNLFNCRVTVTETKLDIWGEMVFFYEWQDSIRVLLLLEAAKLGGRSLDPVTIIFVIFQLSGRKHRRRAALSK